MTVHDESPILIRCPVLLPMAFECPALMYALAASSSAHLALQNDNFRVTALQHSGATITELKASISKGTLTREMRLAVTLVLCSMESISCGTDKWTHHLSGAAACLQDESGAGTPAIPNDHKAPSTDAKIALSRCYEGRWLLRNFAYHDIIMSVSLDRRPLISGDYWLSEDSDVADPYFGLAACVIYLIGEISNLNADFITRSTKFFDEAGTFDSDTSSPTLDLSPRARNIERQLREWSCPKHPHDASLELLAEAYRQGALIHLYRVLRRHVLPHREILNRKISECVVAICGVSKSMARGCYAETSMIFPLFMAGGEAGAPGQIETVKEGLCSLNRSRRFRNVDACVEVLDEVWKLSSAGSGACNVTRVDWVNVARNRGWKLALF